MEMFGAPVSCYAPMTARNISVYDDSNDASLCNDLTSTIGEQVVGSSSEKYVGSWCTDVVTDAYIPPSSMVNSLLAPYLPPFVLQSVIEGAFDSLMSTLPFIFPGECLTAQRKLMCSMIFMDPYPLDDLSFVFGTIYLPSFPANDLCVAYDTSCAASLLSMLPSLAMNCSARSGPLASFPSEPQTMMSLNFGYGEIDLITPPNYLLNSTLQLVTECPRGFDVPEHPEYGGIGWIPNTACAMLCPGYMYSDSQFSLFTSVFKASNIVSTVLGLGQLINLYVTNRTKRNVFITVQLLVAFMFSLYESVQMSAVPYQDMLCSSRTSYLTKEHFADEPLTVKLLSDNCVAYGILAAFLEFIQFWVCFAVFVELWLRVVRGVKDVKYYRRIYFWGGLVATMANFFLVVFYGNPSTPGPGSIVPCNWGIADLMKSYYIRVMPHTIYFGVAVILSVHVVYHCVMVSTRVGTGEKNPLKKLWTSYRILFLFTMLLFVYYVPYVFWFGNYVNLVEMNETIDSFVDWSVCTFINFVRADNLSYIDVCGAYLAKPIPLSVMLFVSLLIAAENLILFVITLNSDAKQFWVSVTLVLAQQRTKVYMAVYKRQSAVESSSSGSGSHRKSIIGNFIGGQLRKSVYLPSATGPSSPGRDNSASWSKRIEQAITGALGTKDAKVHPGDKVTVSAIGSGKHLHKEVRMEEGERDTTFVDGQETIAIDLSLTATKCLSRQKENAAHLASTGADPSTSLLKLQLSPVQSACNTASEVQCEPLLASSLPSAGSPVPLYSTMDGQRRTSLICTGELDGEHDIHGRAVLPPLTTPTNSSVLAEKHFVEQQRRRSSALMQQKSDDMHLQSVRHEGPSRDI
jgi:hypothetical protein